MTTFDPVVRVEAAWDATPFTDVTAGSWSTVAEFKSAQFGRGGRSSPIDVYGAGSATLEFHDLTRTLDPLNTSSSLNGKLVPDVPIRVVANYSSTDYPLWFGYIDDYDTLFHVKLGEVTIPATDGLRVLAGVTLPDPFRETVESYSPVAWWRFDNIAGLIATDDIGDKTLSSTSAGGLTPVSGWSQVDGLTDKSIAAVRFPAYTAASGPAYVNAALPSGVGVDLFPGTAWSVSMWINIAAPPTADTMRILYATDTTGDYVTLIVLSTGVLRFAAGSADAIADSPTNLCDGATHHIVMVRSGTTITLYVDGLAVATDTEAGFTGTFGTIDSFRIGEVTTAGADIPAWTLDDLVFIPSTLSAADVQTINDAYLSLYGGTQQTGERIDALFDLVGLPAGLRAFDTGEVQVGPQDIAGRPLLDVVNELTQTEGGRFFQAKDGDFTFHDAGRPQRETVETTSQVTFTDTTSGVLYEKGIRFRKGFHDVIDRMDVTRAGGLQQTATAVANPLQSRTLTTVHASDAQARNLAERIVALYGTATTRVDGWSTQPEVDGSSFWAVLLGLELGYRVTVNGRPLNTGSTLSIDQHLDSISFDVGATFRMSFTGQRVDPNTGVFFTWGGDGATQGWGQGVWR